ncbi:MAG: hypothetical protein UV58_C0004G0027 [Candidatus Wolfebacteria bacterium GW2011_GWC1_43_10]|uniref:Uncharacterized protein n=1 Tax=Candidatus Wolfebacteria bacterium GW2011_GWC1_43_10 TaxID=1619011 RepID=A0A0G1CBR1_9BACT|nr:MAG: hypothetical protein UV58_C0004G0027 [Candidatus Wolfebacteria bacterium GW2011_GWC1_43_10]
MVELSPEERRVVSSILTRGTEVISFNPKSGRSVMVARVLWEYLVRVQIPAARQNLTNYLPV